MKNRTPKTNKQPQSTDQRPVNEHVQTMLDGKAAAKQLPGPLAGHRLILRAADNQQEADGISSGMLRAAKCFCGEDGKTFDLMAFRTWCQLEEDWIKSDAAGQNKVARLPRVWTQVKSDISKAWEKFKILPAEHETVNSFREALQKARKAAGKVTTRGTAGKGEKPIPSEAPFVVDPLLSQRFTVLSSLFDHKAKDEKPEQVAERQQSILDAVDELIANLKATHTALVGDDLESPESDEGSTDPELDEGMQELEAAQITKELAA